MNLREEGFAREKLYEDGKQRRGKVPRESHAEEWTPPKNRPDPVATLLASNKGRQKELVPLGMSRMASSPFTFLRWAAAVMAWDLSKTPSICGALLARAHARTGEPALIAGYCGGSKVLDEALADWAEAYGDQTASDRAALVAAIKSGRVPAASSP